VETAAGTAPSPQVEAVEAHAADLLFAVLPVDPAALETALQQFLGRIEGLGQQVSQSLGGLGLAPWLVAVATAFTTYELSRRHQQAVRTGRVREEQAGESLPWPAGAPCPFTPVLP
jgi:hypothetical protein